MRHILFSQQKTYETAVLIKETAFYQDQIERHYIEPLTMSGYPKEKLIAFSLEYMESGKAPAGYAKAYLSNLLPALKKLGIKYLYCADSNYFKALTKNTKADSQIGYTVPCAVPGYEDMQVIMGVNYQALTYNPLQGDKLDLSVKTLASLLGGSYKALGADIIKWAYYPQTEVEVDKAFAKLHTYPELACDLETYSLHFLYAGLGTIAFSPDTTGGVAFNLDIVVQGGENTRTFNVLYRQKLKKFLTDYKGKLVFHKADYDIRVLIYNLWMTDPLDNVGMLEGLEVLTRNFDDSRIIAYLALNSTAGNELGLKVLAHPFAGNWAKDDITNILLIPMAELLQYNVVDTMSTMWVKEKHWPTLVREGQKWIYNNIMMPSLKTIIQIEMVGMPLEASKVAIARKELEDSLNTSVDFLRGTQFVKDAELQIQTNAMNDKNAKLKTRQDPIEAFSHIKLNPASNQQLQLLLYEVMKLPVIELTKTRQPSTSGDTLDKLKYHCRTEESKQVLKSLIDYSKAAKILSSFIPSFEAAFDKGNGRSYLHGNFNLGGTLSGRLSSSDPNLQQIPSGSKYGKLIKQCFSAPKGWIFAGADFNALEDRINALLTQDPNKIKVFTDGYDPHSMRTYAYWPEKFKHLPNTVEGINRIQEEYKEERSDSKPVSFALQYLGTWATLVKNCGFSKGEAQSVENNFHQLYAVSTTWVKEKITQATKDGYGIGAFGLRIRTPLLKRSILGTKATLREAEAEGRSLGNAISGQSYGLLTNYAANRFMERVWKSKFKYDILPVALIHDAIYVLVRDNTEAIKFVNDNLIECMAWKGLPEISDPRVPLPANLDLYWPDWSKPITLDNNLSEADIRKAVNEALIERKRKAEEDAKAGAPV